MPRELGEHSLRRSGPHRASRVQPTSAEVELQLPPGPMGPIGPGPGAAAAAEGATTENRVRGPGEGRGSSATEACGLRDAQVSEESEAEAVRSPVGSRILS